ncbi:MULTISPECIES: hypothetical protein [Frankia]|uniref:hypothetical protein n=1 Tax=Frankia TaxID=1854 RepID=UPI000FF8A6D6|nr:MULTISPECIES: hypothetical protein [Frankia]
MLPLPVGVWPPLGPVGVEGAVPDPPPRGGELVRTTVPPGRAGEAAGGRSVFGGWRVVPRGGVLAPPARWGSAGARGTPATRPGVPVRARLDGVVRG